MREDGKGLIGLDLDVSWNKGTVNLRDEDIKEEIMFKLSDLPLFQSAGDLSVENERVSIRNITAASLPRANTGVALGNKEDPIVQTLFARIPISQLSDSESQDFKIEINAFPTAGGIEAEEEDLMILEDPERKDSWVIEVKPTQTEVGNM